VQTVGEESYSRVKVALCSGGRPSGSSLVASFHLV